MRFMHFVKPLSRYFRATPTDSPAARDPVAALDSGSPELITATALGDGEAALRAAAIARLPDGETLRSLAGLSDGASPARPANLERAAQQRVAQLVDAGTVE